MSLTSRLRAMLTYANEKTEAGDTTIGAAIKTLCDGYSGASGSATYPTITDADTLSSRIKALTAYADETTGVADATLAEAIKRLCDGYNTTPQWMKDAAETYGLDIANLKQAMQDYTFIEYLQSSGVQYIDTGVTSTDFATDLNINIDMQYTETQAQGYNGWDGGGQFGQKNGFWSTEGNTSTVSALSRTKLKVHFALADMFEELLVNEIQISKRNVAPACIERTKRGYPIYVAYSDRYTYNPSKCIVYSCYMLNEEGVNLRFFLPCLRKSDNKPIMLDLLTMTEYVNQGSSDDFTYGDEVTLESKFAELSA